MADAIVDVGATALCPHGGQVSVISSNSRVLASQQPLATLADTFLVAGCAFTVPGRGPQPCTTVRWIVPAARVRISSQPAILETSTGFCLSAEQAPQGPPNVVLTQLRVKGT